MKLKVAALTLFTILAATSAAPAGGANVLTFTDSAQVNITGFDFYNPCTDEMIVVSGYLHIVIHYTLPADGSGNFVQQFNYNNLVGIGQTTGTVYNVVGSYKFVTTYVPGDIPKTDAFKANTLFVGKGNAPNFIAHTTMQATYNANGELTADVSFSWEKCQ